MKSATATNKILVAIRPEELGITAQALGPEFNTIVCHSFQQAMHSFDTDVALVLCGLRFDGGLIFDLLRFAKNTAETRSIPFYSLVESADLFPPAILASIEMASKVLGADGLLHLTDAATDTATHPDFNEKRIRQVIRTLL